MALKLEKGMRVAFTRQHLKNICASHATAARRGTYQGSDSMPGYCRIVWDNPPPANYGEDYVEMARTIGELHPVGIICGVKSVAFVE